MPIIRPATKSLSTILALTISLLSFGCGGGSGGSSGGGNTPTITSVTVVCSPGSIYTNQTSTCTPTVSGTGNYSSSVTWSVSPTSIGTVSSAGVLTPVGTGTATITATSAQDSTKSGNATVTVVTVTAPSTITSVSVTCSPASILTTQTSNCTATVQGTGSYSSAVTWGATDGTITSSEVFTPTAAGTAVITATSTQDTTKSGTTSVVVGNASSNNEWVWMGGSDTINAAGVYGTQGVPAATNVPGARDSAVSSIDQRGNLWLFGGYGIASSKTYYGIHNDLWEFNLTAKEWTWVSGSNTLDVPGVYGTQGVAAATNVPGARYGSVSWIDNSGNFWLFGGSIVDKSDTLPEDANDLWEFNPITAEWTWISGSNTYNAPSVYGTQGVAASTNVPGARFGSAS